MVGILWCWFCEVGESTTGFARWEDMLEQFDGASNKENKMSVDLCIVAFCGGRVV